MPTYQFITGELVTVEADTLEQALELMAKGAYEFQEAITEHRPNADPCPNHQGAYDCTSFCSICQGEQEVKPCPLGADKYICSGHCPQCKGWQVVANR